MTTVSSLADVAVTPAMLLERVDAARQAADAAEREVLVVAVEWAHAHPPVPGDESWAVTVPADWTTLDRPGELDPRVADAEEYEEVEWCGIPPLAWDAPAAFAAANRTSTTGGKALIRDALVLAYRLPRTWQRVLDGDVPAWRARRIAQAVLGSPADVVAEVDLVVSPIAETAGPVILDRAIEAAMCRLHAEEREARQAEALAARGVEVEDDPVDSGLARLHVRGDYRDVHDFADAVTAIAAALKAEGCDEPLDVRRSMAVGVLADPDRAATLLNNLSPSESPAPRRQVILHLRISDLALLGLDPVALNETTGRAVLEQAVRAWCGRTDTHLTVKPILDVDGVGSTTAYAIPDTMRTRTTWRHPTCVFPWCTRPARRCDLDHICSHACGGPTADHNLAPLCRHHHRLKTHTPWTYEPLDPHPLLPPTTFIWTDPHGRGYVRGPTGTTVIETRTGPPPAPTPP